MIRIYNGEAYDMGKLKLGWKDYSTECPGVFLYNPRTHDIGAIVWANGDFQAQSEGLEGNIELVREGWGVLQGLKL